MLYFVDICWRKKVDQIYCEKKKKKKKEKDENGESLRRLREKEKGDEDENKFFLLRSGLTGY